MAAAVQTRRSFISALAAAGFAGAGSGAAGTQGNGAEGAKRPAKASALKVTRYAVMVGAERPFSALHISDTHLAAVDVADGVPSPRNAAERRKIFPGAEAGLEAALDYARGRGEFVINTGDLIDYVNEGNLAAVRTAWREASRDGILTAGNHEFCQMVGDGATEDEAYKAASRARVQSVYPDNLLFSSRIVCGVNFVSFDNVYYYVPAGVPEMFEAEAARGLPIVVCCHVPFYTEELCKAVQKGRAGFPPYLSGAPDSVIDGVKDPYRRTQQRSDRRTLDFVARLKSERLVKAVLCGHLHWAHVGPFSPTAMQYCVGANYKSLAHEFSFG